MKRIFREQVPFFLGIPALIWQVLFVYIPLLVVLYLSVQPAAFEFLTGYFSWYYVRVIARSVFLGLVTTAGCLVIGYPVAYWMAICAGRGKNFLLFLLFIPFWTNFLLHLYAWMFVLDRNGVINTMLLNAGLIAQPLHLLNTMGAVFLVMVYCYAPFMIFPIYTSLEKFDTRLLEASADLGASWWQTMWRVVVPSNRSGMLSGIYLVLVPAFGEFVIPELMGGDRIMFAGSVVSYYTMQAHTASWGAIFTMLVSLVLLVVLGIVLWSIRRALPVHAQQEQGA
ncbi:MAG: ABC transporter permease [Candidatus Dependentiae bacterium]|nr:ABC transporter permease [Candidatus Dependentiae bacterium]